MEMNLKESNIELTIKCTKVELEHVAKTLKYLAYEEEDDEDDCDCGESSCFDCSGYKNYKIFKKLIGEQAGVVMVGKAVKKSNRFSK